MIASKGMGTVVPKDTGSTPLRQWFPGHWFSGTVVPRGWTVVLNIWTLVP